MGRKDAITCSKTFSSLSNECMFVDEDCSYIEVRPSKCLSVQFDCLIEDRSFSKGHTDTAIASTVSMHRRNAQIASDDACSGVSAAMVASLTIGPFLLGMTLMYMLLKCVNKNTVCYHRYQGYKTQTSRTDEQTGPLVMSEVIPMDDVMYSETTQNTATAPSSTMLPSRTDSKVDKDATQQVTRSLHQNCNTVATIGSNNGAWT